MKPYRWQLGSRLSVGSFIDPLNSYLPAHGTRVRIVGTYRPKNTADPFWFGVGYFNEHRGSDQPPVPPTLDALFVSRQTMLSVPAPAYGITDFDYPLRASAVRLNNERAERAAVGRLVHHRFRGSRLRATSGLARVLNAADSDRRLLNIGTLLVTLQLGVLAWLVLFQVVADAVEARGNEIAMAKLRGHGPLATIRFGLSEPLLLLLAAVPLGIGLARLITGVFAAHIFAPGIPVLTTTAPIEAAFVAFLGGLLAAALAGYTTLTRSVLEQWRRTTRRPGHGRLALAGDIIAAAAAITALIFLLHRHSARSTQSSASLLTPGLLVLAVALIGVRLLPVSCRALARATRASRHVGTFLASRQVARRPLGLRLASLLAVAVGLATFAVAGESVATANRRARAAAELGANRVASVQFEAGHDPVAATHRADPHGRWAMAVATWLPDGGGSVLGTVLGLDSTRLAAVGENVSGGLTARQLARAIAGSHVPPISTTSSRLRIDLTASNLTGAAPQLMVNLRTPSQAYVLEPGSRIHDGSHRYVVKLHCHAGCTLRGLIWNRPINAAAPMSGTIEITGIQTMHSRRWQPINLGTRTPHSWRPAQPEGQAQDQVSLTRRGVTDRFSSRNGGYGGIEYASDPSPIPAVATPASLVPGMTTQITDASSTTVPFHVVRTVNLVPEVLTDGVVMDIRYLDTQLPAFSSEANWQIWLGPRAPPNALQRLRRAGLIIQSVRSLAQRQTILARQGPALALLLLLACAVAGAVLAAGGTASSISASGRRRAYELAALNVVGVKRRALGRSSVLEQLLLLGTAVLLGVPTGVLAARIAMPTIPEFADQTPITLHYTPQVIPTALFVGSFIALLVLTALVAAQTLIRAAVPALLRESEG